MQNTSKVLEDAGYLRSVAGSDFDKVVEAYNHVCQETNKGGLFFMGDAGCGKTTLARILAPKSSTFIDLSNCLDHKLIEPYKREVLVSGQNQEIEDWWTILDDHTIILDDLGNENIKSHYGNKVDIVAQFIMRFYCDSFQRDDMRSRLVITSNLSENELLNRYGFRIMDRIYSMCCPVHLQTKSARKYQKRF